MKKKNMATDRSVVRLQNKADKAGVRLRYAEGSCTSDSDCIDKMMKSGKLKDRQSLM